MIELPICDVGAHLDPTWNTAVRFIQANDDLPIPDNLDSLYLDFETTSGIPNVASTNPHAEILDDETFSLHRGCKIAGAAFLFDEEKYPYYVPLRHAYLEDGEYKYRTGELANYSIEKFYDWLERILRKAKFWKNHQIKYDYHVAYNETGIVPQCKLVCSVILSKLCAIPERLEYGLTGMMREFGVDITPYEDRIHSFLGKKLKDYGLIPPDHCAVYAGVDVLSDRFLIHKATEKTNQSVSRVKEMELQLLPILIKMEQVGIRVDIKKLVYDWERLNSVQNNRIKRIKKYGEFPDFVISGKGSKKSHYEFFVEHLGWRLDYTETSQEKLKKKLIKEDEATFSYGETSIRKHAQENPRLVASYLAYQADQKLLTSYTQPTLEHHISSQGLIHCNVNQQLHTGRMSVTAPAMQTLPIKAKWYIIPYTEDYVLVEFDLSQIEFRVIVHYINNRKAITAYQNDPTTDFHKLVQQWCQLQERRPAKTCNFLLGYGGGKLHFIQVLTEYLLKKNSNLNFDQAAMIALKTYDTYHAMLPELKPTSYRAGDVIKSRGFVRTLLGRERYIPKEFFFKAFNSVCQGTAADMQKDITLRLNKFIGPDCLLHMLVHDSWLFSIRKERVSELIPEIKYEIERPIEGVDFQIPLLSDYGVSDKCWRLCKD